MDESAAQARALGSQIRNFERNARGDFSLHGEGPILKVRRAAIVRQDGPNVRVVGCGGIDERRAREVLREAEVPVESRAGTLVLRGEHWGGTKSVDLRNGITQARVGVALCVINAIARAESCFGIELVRQTEAGSKSFEVSVRERIAAVASGSGSKKSKRAQAVPRAGVGDGGIERGEVV